MISISMKFHLISSFNWLWYIIPTINSWILRPITFPWIWRDKKAISHSSIAHFNSWGLQHWRECSFRRHNCLFFINKNCLIAYSIFETTQWFLSNQLILYALLVFNILSEYYFFRNFDLRKMKLLVLHYILF